MPRFSPAVPLALRPTHCIGAESCARSFRALRGMPSGGGNSLLFLLSVSLKAFLVSLCVQSAPYLISHKKRSQHRASSYPTSSVQDGATDSKLQFILTTLSPSEHPFTDALAELLLLTCFTRFCHSCFPPSKLLLKNLFDLEWDFASHLVEPCHPRALVDLNFLLTGFLIFTFIFFFFGDEVLL